MKRLSIDLLKQHEAHHENVAPDNGPSDDPRDMGFRPAFFDYATGLIYVSRYRDGREAPFHLLDGLPDEAVATRASCGKVVAAKATLIQGFERSGYFYTRRSAARAVVEWSVPLLPGDDY
ncbi:MAG TPA: hypothetical protein VFJ62_19605 [Usitatibacter sp.]|nr:hypothetical protein [Usitatibacter sp.]